MARCFRSDSSDDPPVCPYSVLVAPVMEKWGSPSTTRQSVLKNYEKKGVAVFMSAKERLPFLRAMQTLHLFPYDQEPPRHLNLP